MTPSAHPDPSALLAFHEQGDEYPGRAEIAAHLEDCVKCRSAVADLDWIGDALRAWPDATPPADTFERVLERIEQAPPLPQQGGWAVPVFESLLGVALAVILIHDTARWISELPIMSVLPLGEPLRALSAWGAAIVAFFALGSLLTLAIAPALFLDSDLRRAAPGTLQPNTNGAR